VNLWILNQKLAEQQTGQGKVGGFSGLRSDQLQQSKLNPSQCPFTAWLVGLQVIARQNMMSGTKAVTLVARAPPESSQFCSGTKSGFTYCNSHVFVCHVIHFFVLIISIII
jgi:hypothetical protein